MESIKNLNTVNISNIIKTALEYKEKDHRCETLKDKIFGLLFSFNSFSISLEDLSLNSFRDFFEIS